MAYDDYYSSDGTSSMAIPQAQNVADPHTNATVDGKGLSGRNTHVVVDMVPEMDNQSLPFSGPDLGGNNIWTRFNKYKLMHAGIETATSGYGYMFMTTPCLNLTTMNKSGNDNIGGNPLFNEYYQQGREEYFRALSYLYPDSSPFIIPLTSMCDSFEASDISVRTKEFGETFAGYKIIYPMGYQDSTTGGTFNVKYQELAGLPILRLHQLWVEYIECVRFGDAYPAPQCVQNYEIDYMSSAFYFSVEPDGETIQYWCQYIGVMPVGVPYSSLGFDRGSFSEISHTIPYAYAIKQDMRPESLVDFNSISDRTTSSLDLKGEIEAAKSSQGFEDTTLSRYLSGIQSYGSNFETRDAYLNSWGDTVKVVKVNTSHGIRYKLRFGYGSDVSGMLQDKYGSGAIAGGTTISNSTDGSSYNLEGASSDDTFVAEPQTQAGDTGYTETAQANEEASNAEE